MSALDDKIAAVMRPFDSSQGSLADILDEGQGVAAPIDNNLPPVPSQVGAPSTESATQTESRLTKAIAKELELATEALWLGARDRYHTGDIVQFVEQYRHHILPKI